MEMRSYNSKIGINAFWLKIIAIIGMSADHIGIVFGSHMPLWMKSAFFMFGGLTFPIMAYFIGEGYRHTRSFRKYAFRLFVFAIITQLPYSWALMNQLNVIFTLLFGLLAIHIMETVKNKFACILLVFLLVFISLFSDWGLIGVPMILCYYYIKNRWAKIIIPIIFPFILMVLFPIIGIVAGQFSIEAVLPQILFAIVGCTLTVPLLAKYNGQQGPRARYLFYIYYPGHIAMLGLLNGILFHNWGILL